MYIYISDINIVVTLFNQNPKKVNKHRSIISLLKKIFDKHFTVFNVFADTAANFIKNFSLPRIRTIHIHVCLLHSLFLLLVLFVCLFVYSCGYHIFIPSVPSIFVSMYLHLLMFL